MQVYLLQELVTYDDDVNNYEEYDLYLSYNRWHIREIFETHSGAVGREIELNKELKDTKRFRVRPFKVEKDKLRISGNLYKKEEV